MRREDAWVVTFCVGVAVMCALYVANPHSVTYYPVEHTWSRQSGLGVPMTWYGRTAVALGGGLLAMLLTWLLSRRSATKWQSGCPRWLPTLLAAVTFLALAIAVGDTVIHESRRWILK